ncbi:hypothetical protein ACEP1N_32940 [Pseudomonas aeruginosa]
MSFDADEWFQRIQGFAEQGKERIALEKGREALERVGDELDDRVNFRVNSVLKAEFEAVCKQNHTTVSREIKRFMTEVVRAQRVF